MNKLRSSRRPTAAGIIATLALVFAVGSGTAVAAKLITGKQIKNSTIRSADVKNGTVKPKDLSFAIADGIQGPKGDQGAKGEPGAKGEAGAARRQRQRGRLRRPERHRPRRRHRGRGAVQGPGRRERHAPEGRRLLLRQPGLRPEGRRRDDPAPDRRQPVVAGHVRRDARRTRRPRFGGDPCPGDEAASVLVFNDGGTLANPVAINVLFE